MEYFDINDPGIRSRVIVENRLAFSFPSNISIVPGHVLICPKRRVANMEDLTNSELRAIFSLQKQLKTAMSKAFGAEGFNVH